MKKGHQQYILEKESVKHRVQKLLSNHGYCSRRKAEDLIKDGRVTVNGKKITIGDQATEKDTIAVDGKVVGKERKVYLIFNKPVGCVTALRDPQYKTVMSYISVKERVFPVGRLDYNTSGLLLLTNDGDFANKIMHPSHEIKKKYLVTLDNPIDKKAIDNLQRGVQLDDGKTRPVKTHVVEPHVIEISIHEGKNRIVRRMFTALGYRVKALSRVAVGKLSLGDLKVGTYRNLTKKDIDRIFI